MIGCGLRPSLGEGRLAPAGRGRHRPAQGGGGLPPHDRRSQDVDCKGQGDPVEGLPLLSTQLPYPPDARNALPQTPRVKPPAAPWSLSVSPILI